MHIQAAHAAKEQINTDWVCFTTTSELSNTLRSVLDQLAKEVVMALHAEAEIVNVMKMRRINLSHTKEILLISVQNLSVQTQQKLL